MEADLTSQVPDIQIADIEEEFNAFWNDLKERELIRACLFNLVIYAEGKEANEELQEFTKHLVDIFPCRIIFINADQAEESNYLRVTTDIVHSQNEDKSALIYCERINIAVGHKQKQRAAFLLLSHLLPDLPIHLLWGGLPTFESPIFKVLSPLAERLIFHSQGCDNLQASSKKLSVTIRNSVPSFVDLNWARLVKWRKIFSSVFSSTEHLEPLCSVLNIEIDYCISDKSPEHHPEILPLYLVLWIASRMRWSFESVERVPTGYSLFFGHQDGQVQCAFRPIRDTNYSSGTIMGLNMVTCTSHSFQFIPSPSSPKVTVHISLPTRCELPIIMPLSESKQGLTFFKEIFYSHHDRSFDKMLQLLSQIAWPGEKT